MVQVADLAQLVLNGLIIGSIYALGAVGLTLVYGILNLVNFAHGDSLTAGAFVAFLVASGIFGLAPWQPSVVLALLLVVLVLLDGAVGKRLRPTDRGLVLGGAGLLALVAGWDQISLSSHVAILHSLVLSAVFVATLSALLDRTLWARMRETGGNLLTLMIVSIGLAFVLRSVLQMIFGGDLRVFFSQALGQSVGLTDLLASLGLPGLRITVVDVWVLGSALVAVVTTHIVLQHTRTGKAMRALSDNQALARVAGIDTERVILHVWILGGALAGIAGTLLAMVNSLHINLGWFALLALFAAVILGGVGSATGAMLGGLLIGVAQEVSTVVIDPGYKLAVGFAILILTLLVRPRGIMGVAQA